MTDDRIYRSQMLMKMAHVVSERSTCDRLHVGAVLARGARVISTGYNGPVSGAEHCHHTSDEPCVNAVHAETNTLIYAARVGIATEGAALYVTHEPCLKCAQLVINAGVVSVLYDAPYRDHAGIALLTERLGAVNVSPIHWGR